MKDILSGIVDFLCETFSAENYTCETNAGARRFPSFISAIFRWMVKCWFITVPLLWAGALIGCIKEGLPIVGIIIASIIGTVIAVFLIFIAFLAMMALESIAKQISSLILYNELDDLPENPVDHVIIAILMGSR